MTQHQFYQWMNEPSSMNSDSVPLLREVIKRYPYFTAAQMMLAKNLRSENHIDQLKQLQLAAVMVPDRKVLHNYLNDKRRSQVEPIQQEETVENEIESVVEDQSVEEVRKETNEVAEPLFPDDLIPEPIIYQLETAELPELPAKEEETPTPDELSFSEWLMFTESGKLDQTEASSNQVERSQTEGRSTIDLIDHFLSQADRAPKKRAEFFNPRKAAANADKDDFTVVSETLASIYFQQEKYGLAKQAYEALSLKYPEKSVYFAARLKEIEEKLTSE